MKKIKSRLITSKSVFKISIFVAAIIILTTWISGLNVHRSILDNTIISLSILSVGFFLFISIGLYKGWKLKDNIGKFSFKLNPKHTPDLSDHVSYFDLPDLDLGVDEGIGGILVAILFWLIFSGLLVFFLWFFGTFLWFILIAFVAMLYWIFFRALRLVFKNSNKCSGNAGKNILYGIFYAAAYSSWIYLIVFISSYLSK